MHHGAGKSDRKRISTHPENPVQDPYNSTLSQSLSSVLIMILMGMPKEKRDGNEEKGSQDGSGKPGTRMLGTGGLRWARGFPFEIGTKKNILFGKTVVVNLFNSLEIILNALIIFRVLWLLRAIYKRYRAEAYRIKNEKSLACSNKGLTKSC